MEFVSTQKYIRVSPRKLRQVVFMAKSLKPTQAVEALPHIGKRSGLIVIKALKTAIANATAKGVNPEELVLKEIQVGEAPRLKRYRPGSRGAAKPYVRRTSHLRIVLEAKTNSKSQTLKSKKIQNAKPKAKEKRNGTKD